MYAILYKVYFYVALQKKMEIKYTIVIIMTKNTRKDNKVLRKVRLYRHLCVSL